MEMELESKDASETKRIAGALGRVLKPGNVVSLIGDLGAGKTNFVQGVATALDVSEPVTSPTFNLVVEYVTSSVPLYHFDLYRIESEDELEDIDFYYLTDSSSGGVAFIEWADKFQDAMPEDLLEISILRTGDTARKMFVKAIGPQSEALLSDWEAELRKDING